VDTPNIGKSFQHLRGVREQEVSWTKFGFI